MRQIKLINVIVNKATHHFYSAGKFISIEKRSHFRIYIKHLDKSLGISARTNKTLKTAAEMALAKYKLTFDKVSIYIEVRIFFDTTNNCFGNIQNMF